jgi:hypothetical protein
MEAWVGFIWLRIGPMTDFCKYGNKPSISIKGRGFHDQPNNC